MPATAWSHLVKLADREVRAALRALPPELKEAAAAIPVSYEPFPGEDLQADGLEADLLGLFVGEAHAETGMTHPPLPPQIFLFLENLFDYCEGDLAAYCDEVRTTYLHELGHYFGWDEDDLAERGLG
ncbi:MAG: metallopeptidase family protein [Puniceicoccaceae bacterium]|nr:MAG: metallopeptidase family protein [Puniceicoccaceae bacterium]